MTRNTLRILGTRGIPAQHGGFETFAEHLALYLVKRNWHVIVYCQNQGDGDIHEGEWEGVRLIHIPVTQSGALGTIVFDWKSTLHAAKTNELILTLGYNTAVFCILYRLKGITNLVNMDGIEWKRDKWSMFERAWLYLNERAGCWLGNHLVADHPEIKRRLATRVGAKKITMIPYGANAIHSADAKLLKQYGLEPYEYVIVIARPEPENSILEIVTAFSQKKRNKKLVVLGNFEKADPDYRKLVLNKASDEVIFPGAIYEKPTIEALRYFALIYIHGHQVGGTNPSLIEAMGAGNAILAHNNIFNRWVTENKSYYFFNTEDCQNALDDILSRPDILLAMQNNSRSIHNHLFTWDVILKQYETLLLKHL